MYVAVIQFVLSVLLISGLAIFPPSEGEMTLLKLNGAKKSELFEFARRNDLKIMGSAAIPNAVAVRGKRPGLLSLWNSGNVVISGSFAGCGAEGAGQ